MIKIAIVEDEKKWEAAIVKYISDYGEEYNRNFVVDVFPNGMEFISDYCVGGYDLVFMDIAMPHMNGLEAAKRLRETDENVCLIFITTMAQYAVKGYEVNAFDFLIKPVEYELFKIKFSKVVDKIEKSVKKTFTVSNPSGMKKLPLEEITYIESAKHYLYFHTRSQVHKMRGSLDDVIPFFVAEGFAEINRSLVVNLAFVDGYGNGEVNVSGEVLPLSRIYKAEFSEKLAAFLGGLK